MHRINSKDDNGVLHAFVHHHYWCDYMANFSEKLIVHDHCGIDYVQFLSILQKFLQLQ